MYRLRAAAPGRISLTAYLVSAALLAVLVPAVFVSAQDAPLPPELPPGVRIDAKAQPGSATVGDPIRINLEFTLPPGYEVEFPKLDSQVGPFSILEVHPGPDVPGAERAAGPAVQPRTGTGAAPAYLASIVVALYRTGDFEFPPLPLTLRNDKGEEVKVQTPPVKITIRSVLEGADPNLKNLKRQAEIEEPVRWLLWLTIGVLLLALALLAWWLSRRRRRPEAAWPSQPQLDPLVVAEADLRNLLGLGLLEKGLVKQFYVSLSDIVKRMIEAGYGVQTIEKTTSEIMAELRDDSIQGRTAENLVRVETLLLSCDMVKFAKYSPSRGENDRAVAQAFEILADCRRPAPAMTGPAAAAGVPQ